MGKNEQGSKTLSFFIVILTLILTFLATFDDGKIEFKKDQMIQMGVVGIGAIILTVFVHRKSVRNAIEKELSKKISWIKMLNAIVVEYRRSHLEFLDPHGKRVSYSQQCTFNKIKKVMYHSRISVAGKISDEIHTYNCYNSLNHSKNEVAITYGRKSQDIGILQNKKQLQFGFVLKFIDSFPEKRESWETVVKHYTKIFDLTFTFRKKNPPRDVKIYEIIKDDQGNEIEKLISIDPLILEKYNRIVVKIKLLHLEVGSKFKVYWNWEVPKKGKKP